jgi:hypothetical protein
MAALVAAIYVLLAASNSMKGVDGRDERGHDDQ